MWAWIWSSLKIKVPQPYHSLWTKSFLPCGRCPHNILLQFSDVSQRVCLLLTRCQYHPCVMRIKNVSRHCQMFPWRGRSHPWLRTYTLVDHKFTYTKSWGAFLKVKWQKIKKNTLESTAYWYKLCGFGSKIWKLLLYT